MTDALSSSPLAKLPALPSVLELRARFDAMAVRRGWPTSSDVGRLARVVTSLSAAYNTEGRSRAEHLPARLAFWVLRDMPKVFEATRELARSGLLSTNAARLRVLDFGAGLGASTLGLVYALRTAGFEGTIEAVLVDQDADALGLAKEILGTFPRTNVEVRTSLAGGMGAFDFLVMSQAISELDHEILDADARALHHASMLLSMTKEHLVRSGAFIVVEPALRDRTRHLHRVRDHLVRAEGVHLFAPCLHTAPCPALAHETDWCHEDRLIDLPEHLVPIAKLAGLRWEGLTFSFLVLRREPGNAKTLLPASELRKRVVSDLRRTKGKSEVDLCGESTREGGVRPESTREGGVRLESETPRMRYQRLSRHESDENAPWDALRRGDIVGLSGDLAREGRIVEGTRVTFVRDRG